MNDAELDELLERDTGGARGGREWGDDVTRAVASLVRETRTAAGDRRPGRLGRTRTRPRRRGLLVGAAVAGALALTAAAGVTASQLGIPPFQTLEPGVERVATAVPITYTESDGTPVTCKAFMEFRHLGDADQDRVVSFISSHDWAGTGQAAYDAAHAAGGTADDISLRFSNGIDAALFAGAKTALPQVVRGPGATSGVVFNGYGMSCSPQNAW